MTPEEIEAERQRFEAWWQQRWALSGTDGIERDDDEYFDHPCEHAWTGWLAAIASERDRASDNDIVNDLALLIKRMARSIAVGSAGANGIASKAMDYLKRKGLQGSILRDEKFENERRERWESEE